MSISVFNLTFLFAVFHYVGHGWIFETFWFFCNPLSFLIFHPHLQPVYSAYSISLSFSACCLNVTIFQVLLLAHHSLFSPKGGSGWSAVWEGHCQRWTRCWGTESDLALWSGVPMGSSSEGVFFLSRTCEGSRGALPYGHVSPLLASLSHPHTFPCLPLLPSLSTGAAFHPSGESATFLHGLYREVFPSAFIVDF